MVLLYVFVQVSRIVVVGLLFPFLKYFGHGLDWKEAVILSWSGLRGAVALSLSLSVKRSSDRSTFLDQETGKFFVFFTGGIVFLTLVLNGSTTQFALHFLGMDKLSAAKKRIMNYTKYEMINKALEAFTDLGDDEEFGPVDWLSVKRYISTLNNSDEACASQSDNRLGLVNVEDIRIRLLNGVQAAYWRMLDDGRITQATANFLMQSVDEAIDRAPYGPLSDWNGLKDSVHFPSYYKFLQSGFVPPKLGTYFIVERLESACYICAAFLRAHRIARRQLHDFIGNNTVTAMIINESEAEGEEARMFLEEVRLTFPQVLRVVKTRQVAYSVLNHLIEYVQDLEKVGLLEQKEMLHLHDSVQTDLKRLLRNPPIVKIPSFKESIEAHPLLGALPSWVHEPLVNSTKDVMNLRGVPLYREGTKPSGIWLICNGVVKWKSKSIKNNQSVHPTFTHGSSLGLYELLVGKPYLCDMITDSVVVCCFIEKEKIVSLLRTDPAVEDFLWQESAIVLAKILRPQLFETMPMPELRTLVAERSIMTNYLRGESIEVPQQSIGFILEGFIKMIGIHEELITSPAALIPSHGNQNFRSAIEQSFHRLNMSSGVRTSGFTYTGSGYVVETRARIIFFDISSIHVESGLRRGSSSLLSHGAEHPPSREHGGLMSWPEKHQTSTHQLADKTATTLSARALQLSIFGSKVDLPTSNEVQRSQSLTSFHGFDPSPINARRLVSVRSEGGATNSRNVRRFKTKKMASAANIACAVSSDDESGGEEEHIVRIDSPSRLSFRHPS